MIKEISLDDIPDFRGAKLSPARKCAREAIEAFSLSDAEACEIEDIPEGISLQQLVAALRNEMHNLNKTAVMKATQRKGRVFLIRLAEKGRVIEVTPSAKRLKIPQTNPRRRTEQTSQ